MKFRSSAVLLIVAAACFSLVPCKADPITYTAHLSASSEVPTTKAVALGDTTVQLTGDLLSVHIDLSNFFTPRLEGQCTAVQVRQASVLSLLP